MYRLDQSCFLPGIAYSKWSLQYFLNLPEADCLVAEEGKTIAGFLLAEENPPLAHIITLDVAPNKRRVGWELVAERNGKTFSVSRGAFGAAGNGSGQ